MHHLAGHHGVGVAAKTNTRLHGAKLPLSAGIAITLAIGMLAAAQNDTITRSTCATIPNVAIGGSDSSVPIGPALFALVVIGSLGALTLANMRTARRRR